MHWFQFRTTGLRYCSRLSSTHSTLPHRVCVINLRPKSQHTPPMASSSETKSVAADVVAPTRVNKRERKRKRAFDFARYHERHVAIRIAYIGAKYLGFASFGEEDDGQTVESQIFMALTKACLVPDRPSCSYARCGRTDKGVSAFGQVISLRIRSNLNTTQGDGVRGFVTKESATAVEIAKKDNQTETPSQKKSKSNSKSDDASVKHDDAVSNEAEIDYVSTLNRILPLDIRATAWAEVDADFNARFSTVHRSYKYYFLQENMNIENMREAATTFVGEHDFRNFCKMDIANGITTFRRRMLSVTIDACGNGPQEQLSPQFRMFEINVLGNAFLWHQIRNMAAVLFMVGRGDENPSVVAELLDVEKNPRKPNYDMASDLPLVLFDCTYKNVEWIFNQQSHTRVYQNLFSVWKEHALRCAMLQAMLGSLDDAIVPVQGQDPKPFRDHGITAMSKVSHIPIFKRSSAETLESKIITYNLKEEAKAKLVETADSK
eukprot:m.177541 g.177541  ORF g.177541 m.177541 type:complete len:491 (+) comp31896_c1_seq2:286-1758(+)